MPRTRRLAALAAAAVSLAAAAPAAAQDSDARGQRAFAVDAADQLYTFTIGAPLTTLRPTPITGLPARARIVGIDERPLTGQLYAVVRATSNLSATVYTIDPATSQASFAFSLVEAGTSTPITLNGDVGVDFNPMADALRIVTSTGQNLRALPSARVVSGISRVAGETFIDGTLNYNGTTATGITEAAYLNNVPGATSTMLFDIDTLNARAALQSPPNTGTLLAGTSLALGGRPVQGFDFSGSGAAYLVLGGVRRDDTRVSGLFDADTPAALRLLATFPTNAIVDFAADLP